MREVLLKISTKDIKLDCSKRTSRSKREQTQKSRRNGGELHDEYIDTRDIIEVEKATKMNVNKLKDCGGRWGAGRMDEKELWRIELEGSWRPTDVMKIY